MGITTKILNYFHCLCLLSLSLMNSRGKATSQALRFCFISGKNFPVDQRSLPVPPNWQWLRTGPVCRNYSASNGTTAVYFLLWVCPLHLPIRIVIASPLSSLPPTDSNPRPPAPHPPPKPSAVDGSMLTRSSPYHKLFPAISWGKYQHNFFFTPTTLSMIYFMCYCFEPG